MSEEFISVEHRSATKRREYWQQQYETTLAAGDQEGAANALCFVQEYDSLIVLIETNRQDGL